MSRYQPPAEVLGQYFRRGWDTDGTTLDEIAARIRIETPPDRIRALHSELDRALGSGLCEPQFRDLVLYELECDVEPTSSGLDFSSWLRRLRDLLSNES